jgi:hypothetical protein
MKWIATAVIGVLITSAASAQDAAPIGHDRPGSRNTTTAVLQAKKATELAPKGERLETLVRHFESIFVEARSGLFPLFSMYHGANEGSPSEPARRTVSRK